MIREGVRCYLVGLDDPARQLLSKARDWLQEAIRTHELPESHDPDGYRSQLYRDLALCNWLLDSRHDAENLARSLRHREQFLGRTGLKEFPYLDYLDAEEYGPLMAWSGDEPPEAGEDDPMSFHNFVDEGQFARVLAYGYATGKVPAKKMRTLADKFLRRQVGYMLTTGYYATLARWLKVLVWKPRRDELTARQAVLAAYTYVDGVKPPA